jgi:hypothetical protein
MADNEAKLDILGDSRSAEAAFARLTRENAKLQEQNRKLVDDAKKGAHEATQAVDKWAKGMSALSEAGRKASVHSDESWKKGLETLKAQTEEHKNQHHWLTEQRTELLGIAASYLTIERGLDVLLEQYSDWSEHVKDLGKEHQKLAEDVVKTLHAGGLLKFGAELEEFITGGAGGIATPEQTRQALAGVHAGAPNADLETQKRLTAETVKAAPLGADLQARGTLIGKLSSIDSGKAPGDLADIATFAQQASGNRSGELTSPAFLRSLRALRTGGMETDQAMALAITALQDDQRMREFGKIGELLDQGNKFSPKGNAHRLTPEERLKQQFGQLSPQDRLKALMEGGPMAEAVNENLGFSLKMMPQEQIAETLRGLQTAQRENLATGELEQLKQFGFGKKALVGQETAMAKARQEEELGDAASILGNLQEQRSANSSGRFAMLQHFSRGLRSYQEDLFFHLNSPEGKRGFVRRATEGALTQGTITAEQAQKLIAAIERNTKSTERNTDSNGQARLDINRHSESFGVSASW